MKKKFVNFVVNNLIHVYISALTYSWCNERVTSAIINYYIFSAMTCFPLFYRVSKQNVLNTETHCKARGQVSISLKCRVKCKRKMQNLFL